MCGSAIHAASGHIPNEQPSTQDEYFLESAEVRAFVGAVRGVLAAHTHRDAEGNAHLDPSTALDALQPHFAELLADPNWLPDKFAAPYAASGMGGAIGSWLLFRAADRTLSLFSLVVPPGSATPVHDHLAWGFVGLYRGEQEETIYRRDEGKGRASDDRTDDGEEFAPLSVAAVNHLQPGSFYKLLPPNGDIHAVRTLSTTPSISIHLLANDTGCVLRHFFDVGRATARAFRSGYSNVQCAKDGI
jgi:predicted metal-dependent enzyme (double-stranded beta helix superfamily)